MGGCHSACKDCVLDGRCLLQDNDEVEDCEDVQDYEEE